MKLRTIIGGAIIFGIMAFMVYIANKK